MLTERFVLQCFTVILTINGLNSAPRYQENSLGILSELLGKGSNSPLIVVVDSANHVKTLDIDYNPNNYKSYHSNHNRNSPKLRTRNNNVEALLTDLLRASQALGTQDAQRNRDRNNDRQLAEQCTDEEADQCSKDDGEKC